MECPDCKKEMQVLYDGKGISSKKEACKNDKCSFFGILRWVESNQQHY